MGIICGLMGASQASAQSQAELAKAAVNAVKRSDLARAWDQSFATAPATDVRAYFTVLRGDTSASPTADTQAAFRVGTQLAGADFTMVPNGAPCATVATHLRANCAVEQYRYYVEVAGTQSKGDSVWVFVSVATRSGASGQGVNWLPAVATAVADGNTWRIVRVERVKR